MDGEVGPHVAPLETFSQNGSFLQHQFFPHSCDNSQDGHQLSLPDSVDRRWALSIQEQRPETMEARQSHSERGNWNAEEWNWDSMQFLAQPSTQRGFSELMPTNHINDSQKMKTHILKLSTRDTSSELGLGSSANCDEPQANVSKVETSYYHGFLPASSDTSKHGFADDESSDDVECLTLKLGGPSTSYSEGVGNGAGNGKRSRVSPPGVQHPTCQVDGCRADLSCAKDYHRRHKVCENHSKAEKVSVGHLMQRFCQQCSRFHPLKEFDEGKRSCRRRLAGHNRRRRKTQPDGAAARAFFLAEQDGAGKSTELLSLLKLLSHLQGNWSERRSGLINDQDLLLEYIKNAIRTSLMPDSHCGTSGDGLMYNRDAHHKVTATEQRSHLNSNCGSIGDHASGPALGGAISSPIDPHVLSSSIPGIESLAFLLRGYMNGQEPTVSKSFQETPLLHLLQYPSHATDASSVEKTPQRTLDLSQRGSLPSSSFEFGQPSQTRWESGNRVQHGLGVAATHQFPETFSQQSIPTREKTSAIRGNSVTGNLENLRGKDDLNFVRSSAAVALCSNSGFTRPPSFSSAGVEQQSTSHYAACNQSIPTYDAQKKSNSVRANVQTHCSPVSLYADIQDRTGRISFKLFDRSPKDFPQLLRTQILEWLSQVPSEMESYIRPGCVVFTVYLSMPVNMWEELCRTLHTSLKRLLSISDSDFWCKGQILVQVEHRLAYIVDGEVQDVQLVEPTTPEILAVRPLAVVAGQPTKLILRGHNLTVPDMRVFCAYQGKYALQNSTWLKEDELGQGHDVSTSNTSTKAGSAYEKLCFGFSGGSSDAIGRCFIEVEDGEVGGGFVPLIVADVEVCAELHTLEDEIDCVSKRAAAMAMEKGISPEEVSNFVAAARFAIETEATHFLHDLGWVFQKAFWRMNESLGGKHACFRLPASSMKRLLIYAVEHDWCAVIRRLLDILFSVNVESAYLSVRDALSIIEEVNLLHIAVRRICRPMVDQLLAYEPCIQSEMPCCHSCLGSSIDGGNTHLLKGRKMVFRPDMACLSRATPLHVAACMKDAESMIDALTSDPYQIGLHAWNYAQDAAGQTPLSCALANGNFSYIHMVWKKVLQRGVAGQVTIDIPLDSLPAKQPEDSSRQSEWSSVSGTTSQSMYTCSRASGDSRCFSGKIEHPRWGALHLEKPHLNSSSFHQNHCNQEINTSLRHLGGLKGRMFKPFLLSIVAIAAICGCACVLIQGPPEVESALAPFLWKNVQFGPR